MPECFEVKKVCEYLKSQGILGQEIQCLNWLNQGYRILKNFGADDFLEQLRGQQVRAIQCKAKYSFWQLSEGVLQWHYRFTGLPHIRGEEMKNYLYSIFSLPITDYQEKHIRLVVQFTEDELLYVDQRCLSALYYYPELKIHQVEKWQSLPNDLTNIDLGDFQSFQMQYQRSKLDLKTWLLDQKVHPSGIGNYLACEIAYEARLNPWRKLRELSMFEFKKLGKAMKTVAALADTHLDYHWFKVFKRELCGICKGEIQRQKHRINAQTSHWCPQCQV